MLTRTFTSTLWRPDCTGPTCFFEVPFNVKEVFGRARPPVRVEVNGHTYRSTIWVSDRTSYIVTNKAVREAAGLAPGDQARVTLSLDDAPRVVTPPADLVRALKKNAVARQGWERSSYSHQREHASAIEDAKKPETRARRVAAAVTMLAAVAEKRRPVARKR